MTIAEIILLGPGQGNMASVLGDTYTFKAAAKDTGGRVRSLGAECASGSAGAEGAAPEGNSCHGISAGINPLTEISIPLPVTLYFSLKKTVEPKPCQRFRDRRNEKLKNLECN
jgi:hypothetical protein